MSRRTLLILIGVALFMAALLLMTPKQIDEADVELLFPGLKAGLNDVGRITMLAGGGETVATLERGETQWTVKERSGYPADVGRIRRNLIALANATIQERKTSDPSLYDRLGVGDIDQANATGIQLEIDRPTQGDEAPIAIIIGDTGVRGDMAYVRRPGDSQSLMISADLDLSKEPSEWLARDLLHIPSGDVHAVTISHPDGETFRIEKATREESGFSLLDIPARRELAYATVANSVGGVLANLQLDDVAPAGDIDTDTASPVIARFETFDGLIIEASAYSIGDELKVGFRALADQLLADKFRADRMNREGAPEDAPDDAGPPEAPAFDDIVAQAGAINDRLNPWLYTIPSYKGDQLVKRLDDLLKSKAE